MRTSDVVISVGSLALSLSAALSFDGTSTPEGSAIAVPLMATETNLAPGATPLEAFRSGIEALRQGRTDRALSELEYAADQGVAGALWKLGRMYADGDRVKTNKARSYEYFRRLMTIYSDDGAGAPNARFLSNAFVALGLFYLEGIPGTLEAEPNVARHMFALRGVLVRISLGTVSPG